MNGRKLYKSNIRLPDIIERIVFLKMYYVFDHFFIGNISMRKFCGSDTPELVSTSSILVVKFVSDNVVETMGMNFSYVEGM